MQLYLACRHKSEAAVHGFPLLAVYCPSAAKLIVTPLSRCVAKVNEHLRAFAPRWNCALRPLPEGAHRRPKPSTGLPPHVLQRD